MKKTPIIALATAGILVLALSGCGTTDVAAQDTAAPESVASEDCAADETTTSTDPVTLTDDFGRTVELEKPAERVAVLEWQQIEDTLTLCVTPVAVADAEGYTTWDTAEALPEGVVDVGTRQEPNLDALFATNPDLVIVEATGADDEIISQLEAYDVPVIATIGADAADPIAKMLATFDLIAEATGREERADVVKDEFDAYLADAKGALADADLPTTDFVFFDGWIDGGNVALRPFGQGSLIGELGEELGLTNAWTGEVDAAYGLGQTDIEGMLAVGDATLLHTGTVGDDSDEFLAALDGNSIWKTVPAVAEERIYSFPAGIWTFGGPRSAQQIIDAYVAALSK
ncbi:ABC transporter substrate-binding protein [Microbacterium murale]|uniref:ABC transporter substrate-binding protein n=1 Tax=Microbacterium murale TaxID=1081040 RepID=A0ABQ1RKP1_9MICO|nr:iron-siderophore ABC transporter substrate-binding protein [Microbacterium murale]GGD70865.1 ABC transporter substrate-binding protein [Microbacterium murale]